MAEITMQVQGLRELEQKLHSLGPQLAKNALRSSVNAAAQVVKKEAQTRVPVDTGRLKRALYVKHIREESNATQQTFYVSVRQGKRYQQKDLDAFYWPFVELGTVYKPARPFLRPAFEAAKERAIERIRDKLAERIERIAGQ